MGHKQKIDSSEWTLIGDGSADDPIRPDVFDDEDDDRTFHFDADAEELYEIVEDN